MTKIKFIERKNILYDTFQQKKIRNSLVPQNLSIHIHFKLDRYHINYNGEL